MSNPEPAYEDESAIVHDRADLIYASDVRILAEPGGVQLTFTRPRSTLDEPGMASRDRVQSVTTEVIARVVLPPSAARRLLRLLPRGLDLQQTLAEAYDRETEKEPERDAFLSALAEAELDDEPYTEEQREMAQAGWEEYQRGETIPWEVVRRELFEEEDASINPKP